MSTVQLAENGVIPIWLIRMSIRLRLKQKLEEESSKTNHERQNLINELRESPLAISTEDANEQHYEVPTEFYKFILGPRMKYSSCFWPDGTHSIDNAETESLKQVSDRAELSDGMDVLELGCGWGSFSLWAAEKYPDSRFYAISNSSTQADYIRKTAQKRGIKNLRLQTENMLYFEAPEQFDRIISIEMFEHMRNYEKLFNRVSHWLKNDGKLFVHAFSHEKYTYLYNSDNQTDWMSNYFFTGGIMPSHDLFSNFDNDLVIEKDWRLNGLHYAKTLESWLNHLLLNQAKIKQIFVGHYGNKEAHIWVNRWKMFILACAELFAYENGNQWGVSHYRFIKRERKVE